MTQQPILPGATLGVLGSGQLGRMFAQAAAQMGYHVHVFSPESSSPAGEVAHSETIAGYDDLAALKKFAQSVDAITLEFENIPASATDAAAEFAPVRPASSVLHTTQDRLREKTFLREAGIACTPFAPISDEAELTAAVESVGLPAVLKTTAWGYDGKGQSLVETPDMLREAWNAMDRQPAILEGFVDFHCELSMLVARTPCGEVKTCGPLANDHANHILDVTVLPASELTDVAAEAAAMATAVAEGLDSVGLLCVEFFLTQSGELMVNEVAPRPHNSGHLTIEACRCSQFEQQVRAVCNLPLGSFDLVTPAAAMANLLGDVWLDESGEQRQPNWAAALVDSRVHLHLYGKDQPRRGRKMGHLTALADSPAAARKAVVRSRQLLFSKES